MLRIYSKDNNNYKNKDKNNKRKTG